MQSYGSLDAELLFLGCRVTVPWMQSYCSLDMELLCISDVFLPSSVPVGSAHPHTSLVVVGNYGSAWQVTWANPRLGKVTLNRARLHLSPEYRSAPLPAWWQLWLWCGPLTLLFWLNSHIHLTPLFHSTCRCYRALSQALLGPLVDVLTLLLGGWVGVNGRGLGVWIPAGTSLLRIWNVLTCPAG